MLLMKASLLLLLGLVSAPRSVVSADAVIPKEANLGGDSAIAPAPGGPAPGGPGPAKPQAFWKELFLGGDSSPGVGSIGDIVSGVSSVIKGVVRMSKSGRDSSSDSDSGARGTMDTISSVLGIIEPVIGIVRQQFCRLFSGLFGTDSSTPCGGTSGSRGGPDAGNYDAADISQTEPGAGAPSGDANSGQNMRLVEAVKNEIWSIENPKLTFDRTITDARRAEMSQKQVVEEQDVMGEEVVVEED